MILDCFDYLMATLRGQILPDIDDLEPPQGDCQGSEIIEELVDRSEAA